MTDEEYDGIYPDCTYCPVRFAPTIIPADQKGGRDMRCAGFPLFTSWNNESDRGEACGLFGDGWDSPFQYEGKDGEIVGCYIDRHFIEKTDEKYQEHLLQKAASWEAWMLETEKEGNGEVCILM